MRGGKCRCLSVTSAAAAAAVMVGGVFVVAQLRLVGRAARALGNQLVKHY